MRCRRRAFPRAFSLIEAIGAMTIVTVLGSIASFVIVDAMDAFTRAATAAQLQVELSAALNRIDRELRSVGLKPGPVVAPDISAVTASSIQWTTNSSVSLAADQVMLVEAGAPAAALLNDVSVFTVQAFDESDAALAATLNGSECDAIRRVAISITVQRGGVSSSVRGRTFLRCVMEGAGT